MAPESVPNLVPLSTVKREPGRIMVNASGSLPFSLLMRGVAEAAEQEAGSRLGNSSSSIC